MRKQLVAALAVFTLGAVSVPAALSLDKPQNFSLLSINESFAAINGFDFQRAPVAGDRITFGAGLYKWAGRKRGARVGRLEVLCTFTSAGKSTFTGLCTGQANLPTGNILVEGFAPFPEGPANFVIPIVGGTGTYANVRGSVHIRDIPGSDGNNSNMDFHLLP